MVKAPAKERAPVLSPKTTVPVVLFIKPLLAGKVQKTDLVPAEKLSSASPFEEVIAVLVNVVPEAVKTP